MASDKNYVQFVADQINDNGEITYKLMFGEYGLYSNGKLFGMVCDNKLFIKPTPGGREYIGNPVEAPFYPGGKPQFLIEEKVDDREWLNDLVRITLKELPEPKPKLKPKKK